MPPNRRRMDWNAAKWTSNDLEFLVMGDEIFMDDFHNTFCRLSVNWVIHRLINCIYIYICSIIALICQLFMGFLFIDGINRLLIALLVNYYWHCSPSCWHLPWQLCWQWRQKPHTAVPTEINLLCLAYTCFRTRPFHVCQNFNLCDIDRNPRVGVQVS